MPGNKTTAIPFILAGLLAGIAPWLLGGRAPIAHPILGTLAWAAALSVPCVVWLQYRDWRTFAEYEARRGKGSPNPLRVFGKGLLWTLPLWGFIGLAAISAFNPAYAREGGDLVQQPFIDWLPLVIDPDRSRPAIFFFCGLIAMVALLGNPAISVPRRWIRGILGVLLVNAVVLVWTGLYFRFAGNELMLGRFEPRAHYFFATFYYKNHWAAYALLYCGVAASFFFRDLPRWEDNARQAGSGGLALVAVCCLALTFPVVDSRSGILLFGLFTAVFLIRLWRQWHSRLGRIAVCVIMGGAVAAFIGLSSADLQSNWLRTEQQVQKADSLIFDGIRAVHAPEVCFTMLHDRPVFGWGYQSYDPLFPVYATDYFRDADGVLRSDMEFAHSDYLQHLAEFGLAGTLLLLTGLLLTSLAQSQSPASKKSQALAQSPAFQNSLYLGLLLVCIFALWDFPFSNPAVLANAAVTLILARRR